MFYLDLSKQDTLLCLIKAIHSVKLESPLTGKAADHPVSMALIVKYKDSRKSFSYSWDMTNKTYAIVYKLSDYINNFSKTLIRKTDSDFFFESKS